MSNDLSEEIIFEIFNEVTIFDSKFGKIYVKHFKGLDSSKIQLDSRHYLEIAKKRGLPTYQESFNYLIKEEMWSEDQDVKIEELKDAIQARNKFIVQIKLPSKLEEYKKETNEIQSKLESLEKEKSSLIGTTAEIYSNRRAQKDFLESLLFFDKDFKTPVFKASEESNLDKEFEFAKIYQSFFKKFTDKNISSMVLSPVYSPYLPFSESVIDVFGKSLKDLTAFQIKTMVYARNFFNIFKNSTEEIPEYVAKDPDLLMDFARSKKTEKTTSNTTKEGGTTYFGATKDDIETIKKEDQDAVVLSEEIDKKGGGLNMSQMMKLHGL